jgi:hypothetical protein
MVGVGGSLTDQRLEGFLRVLCDDGFLGSERLFIGSLHLLIRVQGKKINGKCGRRSNASAVIEGGSLVYRTPAGSSVAGAYLLAAFNS